MARPKSRATKKPATKKRTAKKAPAKKRTKKAATTPRKSAAQVHGAAGKVGAKRKGEGALGPDTFGAVGTLYEGGRCNAQNIELLAEAISEVGSIEAAAEMLGFVPDTVHSWMSRGREYWESLADWESKAEAGIDVGKPPKRTKYANLVLAVQRAKMRFEVESLKAIRGAVVVSKVKEYDDGRVVDEHEIERPDWRAHAWVLERLNSKRYGARAAQLRAELAGSEDPTDTNDYSTMILTLVNAQGQRRERAKAKAGEGGGAK